MINTRKKNRKNWSKNKEERKKALAAKAEAEAKRKYETEHADEIRITDSIRKIQEEAAKKLTFLNDDPTIPEVISWSNKTKSDVLAYIAGKGYTFSSVEHGWIEYIKGDISDSISVGILYDKTRLSGFGFTSKVSIERLNEVEAELLKLGFEQIKKQLNEKIETGYENKDKKIKCWLTAVNKGEYYLLYSIFYF